MTPTRALLIVVLVVAGFAVHSAAQFETPNRQFHNETAFPLDGQHRAVACESCHLQGQYKGTPTRCFDCHWQRRQDDRFRLQLGSQCEQCHRPTSWTDVRWDHGGMTGTPLNVPHRQISCQSCHANSVVRRGAVLMCVSCHQQDFQSTRNPNHLAAGFSTQCQTCHRPGDQSFRGSGLNHAAVFPLVGQHALAACATCHVNNVYRGTPRDCVGCHRADYNRTTAPNHAASGFSTACEGCHRPTDASFRAGGFNHAAVFPLVGRHAQTSCAACHVNNVYAGTSRSCVGCHRTAYDRTTSPNHAAAGFPPTCENCHRATDASFSQGTFNHRFPITSGRHRAPCATCHQASTSFQTFTCLSCHEHDRARMDDKHKERRGYRYDSLACYSCHPTGRE